MDDWLRVASAELRAASARLRSTLHELAEPADLAELAPRLGHAGLAGRVLEVAWALEAMRLDCAARIDRLASDLVEVAGAFETADLELAGTPDVRG